ncbi:unnamed protein product [Peronospora farinosa]|uniref:Histone-lysine N-methyltransferase n=1 Tax=Peronospora farinosa TaxID=134698 RepID=A0AAV0UUR9_9STRA|nr:unnamed protein product [Peronospora farinosa]
MDLTCLKCEKVLREGTAGESPLCIQKSVRTEGHADIHADSGNAFFLDSKGVISTETCAKLTMEAMESAQVSRCCVCDGMYHTPCLLELGDAQELKEVGLGPRFTCVNCRSQMDTRRTKGVRTTDEAIQPILVPTLAFPYVRRSEKADKAEKMTITNGMLMDDDDNDNQVMGKSDDHGWRVFTTAVEVCTTCRQVLIATEEKVSCLQCHDSQLHHRCVERHQAEQGTGAKKKKTYRRRGRKRRRVSSTASLDWCAPCMLKNRKQMKQLMDGSIEMRTIAMLVNDRDRQPDEDVEWWTECRVCKGLFCLQDFCDPQENDRNLDEVLQNALLDDELGVEWCCGHCASFANALEVNELVTVVICDGCNEEFEMAALSPPLVEVPEGDWFCSACTDNAGPPSYVAAQGKSSQELVTVLVCSGCDRKFNMASVYPSLQNIPEGDWFCSSCVSKANDADSNAADNSAVPLASVVLLICDMCDGEFDMKTLNPPLTDVPSGDWFCPTCTSTQNFRDQVKNYRMKAKGGIPDRRRANLQYTATITHPECLSEKETVVTVLICDGCDHEFDPSTLYPPLFKIPKGEWFCPACSDVRAAASAALQTCVGCDTKFHVGNCVVDRLQHPSGTVDGVMLCEACRTLQAGYSRRRSVSTVRCEPKVLLPTTVGKKRNRVGEASNGQDNSKKPKTNLSGPPVTDGNSVVIQAIGSHTTNNASIDGSTGPPLLIPKPITMVVSSAELRREFDGKKAISGWSFTEPTVVVADSNDDYFTKSFDDVEESDIFIICDVCFGEFKISDVIGTDDANAVPARPWFCKSCLRAFKRSRKKRPRFSKQMVTEMQVYGRLLRATSAKVFELDAVTRFGNPPNSREERRKMYEFIGKSVGVFLQWHKQWVMGRVMAFHATHPRMHHTVRFDDGVVASLPLYAFPMVIGTRVMIYVKVPALQNRWWPAQVLRLNALARKLLLPIHDEEIGPHANFRLVRIFTNSGGQRETIQYISCWVPKYLCRSMKRFVPPPLEDPATTKTMGEVKDMFSQSVERVRYEVHSEKALLDRVFQALLAGFRRASATSAPPVLRKPMKRSKRALGHAAFSERCAQIAEAMVGKTIKVTSVGSCELSPGAFVVKKFDGDLNKHIITPRSEVNGVNDSDSDTEVKVDLLRCSDGVVYHFEDASAFSELAIMLELTGSDVSGGIPGEFHSKELLEKAIIRETGVLRNNANLATTSWKGEEDLKTNTCSYCLLAPDECQTDIDTHDAVRDLKQMEKLIACSKCDRRFHVTCCDPPHAPISLINPEDGEVLVVDLKIPYVCSACVVCPGCHRRKDDFISDRTKPIISSDDIKRVGEDCDPRWSQWRLPLQAAALCTKCVPYYKANRFCGVCNLVLDDEQLTTSMDLLICSTCHHWTHADCEPDPHPAFHTVNGTSGFTLDVIVDAPKDLSNPSKAVINSRENSTAALASREADTESISSLRTPVESCSTAEEHKMLSSAKVFARRDDGVIKTAKQVEEDFACSLRFKPMYDPKVLHNYECHTCRKVRMLHILYRLGVEDKLDLFKEPVTEAIAPSYSDIIKLPMDLSTMQQKILDEKYTNVNFRSFRDDFELMCLNAVTFNSKERDFLIWREAWRFYGQGQKIFRQTAPKARIKQRGGRHYDALLVAAKRQLPNNSALAGKPQSTGNLIENNEDGNDNEDDDELDDDEDDDNGSDAGSDVCSRGAGTQEHVATSNGTANGLTSELVSVARSDISSNVPNSTRIKHESKATSDVAPSASVNGTASALTAALADHRIVTNEAFVFQTKLRVSSSVTRIPLFQIIQTRTSAHTDSWLDMCAVCGSAGLYCDFMFCVDCGEGFHLFCVPGMNMTRLEDNEQMRAYWRCPNCKMCEICGQPGPVCGANSSIGHVVATAGSVNNPVPATRLAGVETDMTHELSAEEPLVLCAHCDRGYHGSCLEPSISLPPASTKRDGSVTVPIIYCCSCVICTNCEVIRGGSNKYLDSEKTKKDHVGTIERTYSFERSKSMDCSSAQKKKDAEKCPLCQRKWDADLTELMQCDACERWVHPPCDALLKAEPKRYDTLVSDPSALYVCAACRPQERKHLTGKIFDGEGWRCQIIIADIQRKRFQCDSSWKETQMQLEQVERWKRLADHTPIYLYVLRLGEECLRNFAYRSLNFQSDWYHFTKQQELDDSRIVIPEWLLRKANRYMRFKRYVRGPRAAARRRERKTKSFYSKQAVGLNTRQDASAICTIVSEAASCAALLACVHLLYGWRPLPEVVIHLLSSDENSSIGFEHRKLDESLLKRLRTGESIDGEKSKPRLELEDEIATIKDQYDCRGAKRHLVHESSVELTVSGFDDVAANATTSTVAKSKGESESSLTRKSDISLESAGPTLFTTGVNMNASTLASNVHDLSAVQSTRSHGVVVQMTTASPLRGWPAMSVRGDNDGESWETSMTKAFEDTRFCALCFMIGDSRVCGRLIYTEPETWVHVNCVLWSMEVYEDVSGVLHKCSKSKHRSRLIRCDACGLMGATVGCTVPRCATHYHFPCAVDAGVSFLPTGETCCPFTPHVDIVTRRLRGTNGVSLEMATTPQIGKSSLETNLQFTRGNGDTSTTNVILSTDNGASVTVDTNGTGDIIDLSSFTEEKSNGGNSPEDPVGSGSKTLVLSEDDTESNVLPATPGSAGSAEVSFVDIKDEKTSDDGAWKPHREEMKLNGERFETVTKQTQHVLPVINPLPEPRRSLFSDPPLVSVSDLKKKRRAELKRGIKPRPMCYRVGALTVHSLGHIFVGNGSFHTRTAIYPLGYRSSRIFWSTRHLGTRCLYECVISSTEIEARRTRRQKKLENGVADSEEMENNEYDQRWQRPRAVFKITASDDRGRPILASTPEDALIELRSRVVLLYEEQRGFSASPQQIDRSTTRETERNPFLKRSSWLSFALSGDYFFGFGLPEISRHIEELPYAATTAVSRHSIVRKLRQQQQRQGHSTLADSAAATWGSGTRKRSHGVMKQSAAIAGEAVSSMVEDAEEGQSYEFAHELPSAEAFQTAERVMEQVVQAEQRAWRSSGCARTDGFEGNRLFGTPKKAKAMPRRQAFNKEASNEPMSGAANGASIGIGNTSTGGVTMDIEHLPITMQYRELRRRPFDERMLVRKSSIHGYGLFLKESVSEGQMIVEYQGQMVCQSVADERERRYEEQGVGSCYMFRLDEKTIIDATRCGNLARFINHSCDPKAFARIVAVEGGEKKIVIFAKRAIAVGDEVTYDYKFPIEDEAIRCDCNAPNCIGRMN